MAVRLVPVGIALELDSVARGAIERPWMYVIHRSLEPHSRADGSQLDCFRAVSELANRFWPCSQGIFETDPSIV